MSRAAQRRKARRATHASPWKRRRRRLVIAFLLIVILLIPALAWRVRLASDIREKFASLRAAGSPVDLPALEASLPVLSAEKNGATLYREAAEAYVNLPMETWQQLPFRKTVPLPPGKPISPEVLEALKVMVRENGPILEVLYRAAERPQCRYVDHFEARIGLSKLPHLGATESMVDLLCADALLACEAKDIDQAIRDLNAAVALIDSLDSDRLLMSLLCQWEQGEKLLMVLERLMGQSVLHSEQLRSIQSHFDPMRRKEQWEQMCDVEQCLFVVRISEGRQGGVFRNLLVMAGVGDLNLRAHLNLMADVRRGFGTDLAEQEGLKLSYKAQERSLQRHPFIYATLQSYRPLFRWSLLRDRWDEAQVAQIALALASYRSAQGQYPDSLKDLIPDYLSSLLEEVANGAELLYTAEASDYRLWHETSDGDDHIYWHVVAVP